MVKSGCLKSAEFQSLTAPSLPAVASLVPSGLSAKALTASFSVSERRALLLGTSQTLTVLSAPVGPKPVARAKSISTGQPIRRSVLRAGSVSDGLRRASMVYLRGQRTHRWESQRPRSGGGKRERPRERVSFATRGQEV